ncbi:T9SS type A sorting domain-containing protein [bacterium]|nr:T9SS type A sorting domain-containing protein [bacterium]
MTALLSSGEERRLDSVFARWEAPSTSEMTLSAPWPCPATERVEVSFSLPSSTPARLSLYDLAGRRLTSLSLTPETTSATLELTDYPSGVYLLRLSSELGSVEQRLVISR